MTCKIEWKSLVCVLFCVAGCSAATVPAADSGAKTNNTAAIAGSIAGQAGLVGSGSSAGTSALVAPPSAAGSGTGKGPTSAGSAALTPGAGTAAPSGNPSSTGGAQSPGSVAPVPQAGMMPSTGCGMTQPPASGNMAMDVDGTMREYIVKVPDGYDPQKPYRLIFAWHGLGGTAMQVSRTWYGLSTRSMGSAIFIAGQGLPTSNGSGGAGWPNTGGRDVAFVKKLVEWATTNYCIDRSRIFSTGMSYGGIMSNALGCQMGDVFRAIAPMSGSGPLAFGGRGASCVGQVAAWLSHGTMDEVVTFMSGQNSRDHWLMTNHCQATTTPVGPDVCVAYEGCDAGFPVHWCEFTGGHTVPQFAGDAIWKFFSQF